MATEVFLTMVTSDSFVMGAEVRTIVFWRLRRSQVLPNHSRHPPHTICVVRTHQAMVYSLKSTGTRKPIVIMVTPQVSKSKQKQLAATGSRVLEVCTLLP